MTLKNPFQIIFSFKALMMISYFQEKKAVLSLICCTAYFQSIDQSQAKLEQCYVFK